MLTALLTFLSLAYAPAIPTKAATKRFSTDPCALATAEATATLGADVDFRELASNGIQYYNDPACLRFVADFIVPADANPASEYGVLDFDITGGWATPPSDEAHCTGTGYSIITYKKAAGAKGFIKRSEALYRGEWSSSGFSSGCNFVKTFGTSPPSDTPHAAGTEVWRVVMGAAKSFTMQPVKARIAFRQIPK